MDTPCSPCEIVAAISVPFDYLTHFLVFPLRAAPVCFATPGLIVSINQSILFMIPLTPGFSERLHAVGV